MTITPSETFTLEEALERLDKNYELIFVDYDDKLYDEQIDAVVSGDFEKVYDLTSDFESESSWHGMKYVIEETFPDWDMLSDEDQETVREAIQERDTSDFITTLIRHTPDPLLRINVVDEDNCWSYEEVKPRQVLKAVGLRATKHNVREVDYALANASPEYSTLLGYWVVSVDLEALWTAPEEADVKITNPYLYLGNPFMGDGFITEHALEGVVTVKRNEIHTDKGAFGYGVNEIYGGLSPSQFHADIEVVA